MVAPIAAPPCDICGEIEIYRYYCIECEKVVCEECSDEDFVECPECGEPLEEWDEVFNLRMNVKAVNDHYNPPAPEEESVRQRVSRFEIM